MPSVVPPRLLLWPLPALWAWLLAWALMSGLHALACPPAVALAAAVVLATALAALLPQGSGWRRLIIVAGVPLSALVAGGAPGAPALPSAAALPAWGWAVGLAVLLLAYPLRAWRDAPLFPSPRQALAGAAGTVALHSGARVLDAGCGLGHGLSALRAEFPQARLEGIEWSWPLRLATALRCRWARVRQGDMWAADWSAYALVYLFQRPESMARAWAKAQAELAPGSWLASLDFEVPGVPATAVLRRPGAQPLWLYRVDGGGAMPQPARVPADKPTKTATGHGRP